uniref:Uncharacterized protein n=1 Tax=Poecilia latipinna TaxID=48699 RepID=A0A3B3TUU1_9TELE
MQDTLTCKTVFVEVEPIGDDRDRASQDITSDQQRLIFSCKQQTERALGAGPQNAFTEPCKSIRLPFFFFFFFLHFITSQLCTLMYFILI